MVWLQETPFHQLSTRECSCTDHLNRKISLIERYFAVSPWRAFKIMSQNDLLEAPLDVLLYKLGILNFSHGKLKFPLKKKLFQVKTSFVYYLNILFLVDSHDTDSLSPQLLLAVYNDTNKNCQMDESWKFQDTSWLLLLL